MHLALSGLGGALAAAGGLVLLAAAAAAQSLQPPAPAGEPIGACVCLQRSVAALSAEVSAKQGEFDLVKRQLADLDAQIAAERPRVDVNNPDAVARFKAALDRRDDAYQRSTGRVAVDLTTAVGRYNQTVGLYNRDCANHPFDAATMSQLQATLVCPPPQ